MTLKIVMIAGEASGDTLGGEILTALNKRVSDLEVTGVGGRTMQQQGLRPVFDMADLTVMGFAAAFGAYSRLKKRAYLLIDHIMTTKPDIVVTIDNKGFSMRFASLLKKRMAEIGWSAPIVHLVAPTVWAYAPWRAKKIAKAVDRLLCIFPFEVPYFTRYGLDTIAVGHPAADLKIPSRSQARKTLGLRPSEKVLVVIPGSRRKEIEKLLPIMLDAITRIRKFHPDIKVVLPAASSVASVIQDRISPDHNIQIFDQSVSHAVMASGDYGLICSGTVTLETALCGLKGYVYYKVDWLTYVIGLMVFDRSKMVLANAVTGLDIYPSALNHHFTSTSMAEDAIENLGKIERRAQDQKNNPQKALKQALSAGDQDYASNAAEAVLSLLR